MIQSRCLGPAAPYLTCFLVSCAVPATDVVVPTESMHAAWQHAQDDFPVTAEQAFLHAPHTVAPPGAPVPMIAPPDVRMAYLYEWVDAEGNKHFGHWVAIPLHGFDWVMPDGVNGAMGPPAVGTGTSSPPR